LRVPVYRRRGVMGWRVREGKTVHHDQGVYVGGQEIPCTDEQACSQSMPEAVEWVEEQPVAMVAEVTAAEVPVAAVKATKKRAQ
jgi:hypothetical protein